MNRVRKFYGPMLEMNYDHAAPRLRDLEQLEQIAGRYRSRRRMLMELALDPPNSTQDFAGPPYWMTITSCSARSIRRRAWSGTRCT